MLDQGLPDLLAQWDESTRVTLARGVLEGDDGVDVSRICATIVSQEWTSVAARNHAWSINRLGQTGDLTAVLSSEARLCFATSSVALTETRSNISTKVKRSSTCRLLEVDRKPPACGRNDAHNPIVWTGRALQAESSE